MRQPIENARAKLMRRGKEILTKKGYAGLNMKELAACCQMSTGSVYSYFEGKDDLVHQIMSRDWGRVISAVRRDADAEGSLKDHMAAISRELTRFVKTYHLTCDGTEHLSLDTAQAQKKNMERMCAAVEVLLAQEQRRGEVPLSIEPKAAAYLLVHLFVAAARNQDITFDQIWACLALQNKDGHACSL